MGEYFQRFVKIILELEGGGKVVVDTGGITKYGISKKAYPNLDIERLTEEEAIEIYRRDYWERIRGDEIAEISKVLAFCVFDYSVNSGVWGASVMLQKVLVKFFRMELKLDGVIGAKTIGAIRKVVERGYEEELILRYVAERIGFIDILPRERYGKYLPGLCYRVLKGLIRVYADR